MAILETVHAVDVSTVQGWLTQPARLAKTTRISLPSKDVEDATASLLSALTLQCSNLRMLQLPGNRIGDQGACCLAESLKLLPAQLQILDLSDNCMTGMGAKQLARTFFGGYKEGAEPDVKKSCLRLLDLSKNKIDDHGVAGVARNIAAGRHAAKHTLLSLRDVGCSGQGLTDLAGCDLAGLDIGHNALGVDGSRTVLAARRRNRWRSLRMRSISDNVGSERPPRMASIASCIAESLERGLCDLECGDNYFGENACCYIAEAVQRCSPALRRFSWPRTGFGLRACGALGQGFWPGAGLSNLLTLDLAGNELVDVSVELLCNGFSRCPSLREVQLANNAIGSRGSIVLAGALQAQRHISVPPQTGIIFLGLSRNPVGNSGAKALAEAASASTQDPRCLVFQASWGLEQLELAFTEVGQEGCDALASAMAARAALAEESSRRLAEGSFKAELSERWGTRQPAGLTTVGLNVCSAEVTEMLHAACSRLSAHWPINQDEDIPNDLTIAGEHFPWLNGCQEEVVQDENPEDRVEKEASTGDIELEEFYFGGRCQPHLQVAAATKPSLHGQCQDQLRVQDEKPGDQFQAGPTLEDGKIDSTHRRSAPAKGKGKCGPAKGIGPPPKGKGKSSPCKGKGKSKEDKGRTEVAQPKGAAPFGRRMHWVQPQYDQPVHDTVFGDADSACDLDTDALASLLNGTTAKGAPTKSRTSQHRKTEGIKVLDASRAQNMAIVLSKLPVSSEELCEALGSLEFSRLALSDDMVELLTSVLPTQEEAAKLKSYKDSTELLRDIEQKVLPLCFLPRAPARLRLFRLAASHADTATIYRRRCQTLNCAAVEAKSSQELRKVLAMILRIGNYINHGMKDVSGGSGGARAFSIETLAAITSFKLGNMSTLQFICMTLRRANPVFLEALCTSLRHIPAAAREKSAQLKSCIQTFMTEVNFVEREVLQLSDDQPASHAMGALLHDLRSEVADLQSAVAAAFDECKEAQEYFCTCEEKPQESAPPPYENLFLHLSDFLESLRKAWKETEPAPSQNGSLQPKQRLRKRRDSDKPKPEKGAIKASLTSCVRAFPDPAAGRFAPEVSTDCRQVEQAQKQVPNEVDKPGTFWQMDLDVDALLYDIFATQADEKSSQPTVEAANRHRDQAADVDRRLASSTQTQTANEMQINVDDLIDSIFD